MVKQLVLWPRLPSNLSLLLSVETLDESGRLEFPNESILDDRIDLDRLTSNQRHGENYQQADSGLADFELAG